MDPHSCMKNYVTEHRILLRFVDRTGFEREFGRMFVNRLVDEYQYTTVCACVNKFYDKNMNKYTHADESMDVHVSARECESMRGVEVVNVVAVMNALEHASADENEYACLSALVPEWLDLGVGMLRFRFENVRGLTSAIKLMHDRGYVTADLYADMSRYSQSYVTMNGCHNLQVDALVSMDSVTFAHSKTYRKARGIEETSLLVISNEIMHPEAVTKTTRRLVRLIE